MHFTTPTNGFDIWSQGTQNQILAGGKKQRDKAYLCDWSVLYMYVFFFYNNNIFCAFYSIGNGQVTTLLRSLALKTSLAKQKTCVVLKAL